MARNCRVKSRASVTGYGMAIAPSGGHATRQKVPHGTPYSRHPDIA
jgi:hypothetical protein